MSNSELGFQLVEALERKIETRFHRQTRNVAQATEPGLVLSDLPPELKIYCAWGTVSGTHHIASVECVGGEFEARLTSPSKMNSDSRRHEGVVVGMMTELDNELRFDNKPACDDGAFRAPDGRSVRYRVAAVPTKAHGEEHCGWIAVSDWSSETV